MNRDGNTTIVGITVILILSTLVLYSIKVMDQTSEVISDRLQTYLCFKHLVTSTKKHISQVSALNTTIAALYPLKFTPAAAQAEAGIQTAIIAQTFSYVSYLKNIGRNKYCSLSQATTFAYNAPYAFATARDVNYTVKLRKEKWAINLRGKNKETELSLAATFALQSRYTTKAIIKVNEGATPVLQRLNL